MRDINNHREKQCDCTPTQIRDRTARENELEDLVCLTDFNKIIVRNRWKGLLIFNMCHVQVRLMFFGLQLGDTVNSVHILATSGISAGAFRLFCEDLILVTMGIDLIRDYSSKEIVNGLDRLLIQSQKYCAHLVFAGAYT